ncbi:hypothetical protein SASPL_124377 [Salvia splendens]|uniref:Receptor-like serine/threonine-protein kinase n=1 Tax=Salvia splendens TaxID=180675 RepID=A0A8X8ZUC1_SALSN|nr:hypothetical protein SASPL_124377 [Salvia splendens]
MVLRNHSCSPIHVILLYFCISAFASLADDTISGNRALSGDQTLVSTGDNFVLGFFKPGKSPRQYIGIWYNKVPKRTVVWVANRDTPVSDPNSAKLLISAGNLVLINELGAQIWSTAVNQTSSANSSLAAVLRDDGNLVLSDGSGSNPRSGRILWQSFDNPVHTWLPGGKISYDKITQKKQLLTSWKNEEDPAMGLFSLELDPNGSQYLIKWNRSQDYWTSGAWNGHFFSLVPELRLNYIYNFSYVNNENETYFTYSLYNPTIISRFIMDVSGQIKQLSWVNGDWNLFWTQPREQCQVRDYCGGFGSCQNALPFCSCLPGFRVRNQRDWDLNDYSGGCVREMSLQCNGNNTGSNGRRDRFWSVSDVRLPVNEEQLTVGSAGECESSCFNDCSCTAYAYEEGRGCSVWNGELVNLQQLNEGDGNGKVIHIRLSASSQVFSASKNSKGYMIGVVVGCVGGGLVIVAVIVGLIWRRRKRAIGSSKAVEGSLVAFAYKDLQNATKNFSDKLGGGGFGSVFKGTLPDATVIAAKKLESITQGEKQFRTEVSTIGTIQHVNLVRLRGFCSEGSKKLLVYDYDYMENGSLDSHLFHANETKFLDWKTRYQIALGIARGLSYLHEKCRDCIIHCDIKPENILLDPEFCPKVANFGLSKLVGRDFSRVLTTMRGTRGYLAPEWISGVAITAKADIYSYGMMLFELVSGRRNSENSEDGTVKFFPSWAANAVVNGGDVLGLLDPVLDRNADAEQVVQILEGLMDVNVPPIPRSLQVFVESQEHILFSTDSSSTDQSSQAKSNTSSASTNSKNSAL